MKLKKCQFGMEECSFLGHVVGHGKVKPEDGKIQAVKDFKIPATKKDVRAFLGLVGYYRKFIPHFAETSACLSDLTKHNLPNKVDWKPHHQLAFDTLRGCLQDKPVLICPDYSKQFILQTDASERGVGAVLSQSQVDGTDKPIAFYSRKLLPREVRYSTTEKECLAIVNALKHFSVYLLGRHFTIVTDHGALKFLSSMRNTNGRLTRWALSLQPFDYSIIHRSGVLNGNADGLSRQSWTTLEDEGDGRFPCFVAREGGGDVGVPPPTGHTHSSGT